VDAWGGFGWLRFRLSDVDMENSRGCHRAPGLVEHKNQTPPARDHAKFQTTIAIDRPVEPGCHRLGTKLRVTGNPNCVSTQALDFVMTSVGLDVDRETGIEIVDVEKFRRDRHSFPHMIADTNMDYWRP